MAVSILAPHASLPHSARSCRTMAAQKHHDGAIGGIRGAAVLMASGPSPMPLTIVAPPSVIRCSSANPATGSRVGSTAFSLRSIHLHHPKPNSVEVGKEASGSNQSEVHAIDQNSVRLPRLPSPQNINAKSSSSDSVLNKPYSNKIDSEISGKSNGVTRSPVKQNPKGSVFPNFRILQRLATSARLRSAKKNAILHINAKKANRRKSSCNSVLSDSAERLESVNLQATGLQKAFDKVDHDSGVSSLESPVDTKDENGDFNIENDPSEPTRSTPQKGKRAKKKKKPLAVKIKLKRRSSRSSAQRTTPITFSTLQTSGNIGTLAVPSLGPVMTVEPKKVEIYSSRYNKHKPDDSSTECGVPQGSRSRLKNETNTGIRNSTEGNGSLTLRNYENASTVYGSLPCQIQDTPVTGPSRRKMPTENKITKIFLSEKQSSSIRDCGKLCPCAPPTTPTPEMLKNVEYIPSLSDLRSQRAIKNRLVTMEKEAKERRQRRLEEAQKIEKQLQRDYVALKKHRQRQEIYALNKAMTELENNNFEEFCKKVKNMKEPDKSS